MSGVSSLRWEHLGVSVTMCMMITRVMNSWWTLKTGLQHLFIHYHALSPYSDSIDIFPSFSLSHSSLAHCRKSHSTGCLSNWSNVTAPPNADIPKLFCFFLIPFPSSFFVHFSALCPVCHGISLPLCAACSCMAQAEALKSAVCFNERISEWLWLCFCRFRGLRALQCYLAPGTSFSLTFFLSPL